MVKFDEATHTYTVQGVKFPSVTQVIADMGLYGDTSYFTEHSRQRGKFVHRIIEWYLSGELDESSIDPTIRPYFDAWRKFEADSWYVSDVCEKVMVSDLYRFAGTVDHIGHLNGHYCLIDVKTGVASSATALQTAGYEILVKHPGIKRFNLQLTEDGKYKLTEFKERTDRDIFRAALSLYYWKQNNLNGR